MTRTDSKSLSYWIAIAWLTSISSLIGCEDTSPTDPPPMAGTEVAGEMQLSPAGCEPEGGEQAAGERSAGEILIGGMTAGEMNAGEMDTGGMIAGEMDAGGTIAGDMNTGGMTAGEMTAGEMSAGEMGAGEMNIGGVMAGEMTVIEPLYPEASDRYDGAYFAAFESEGVKSALAQVIIQEGLLEGEVMNRYGELITLGGFIDEQGVLRIPPLTGNMGSAFTAIGRVSRRGSIEGTFTVMGMVEREGSFAGSLNNQPLYLPSPAHDGLYQLSFMRGGQEVAVTTMQIDQGRFQLGVVNTEGQRFSASGFVSEDGTLALLGVQPAEVIAEAYIDPDTKKIEGIYAMGRGANAMIGDITGQGAD